MSFWRNSLRTTKSLYRSPPCCCHNKQQFERKKICFVFPDWYKRGESREEQVIKEWVVRAGGGQRYHNLFVFRRILTHPLPINLPPFQILKYFWAHSLFCCSCVYKDDDDNGDNVFLITMCSPHPDFVISIEMLFYDLLVPFSSTRQFLYSIFDNGSFINDATLSLWRKIAHI